LLHQAASFPPIATKNSRVLILGSMPGIKSLAAQQYYAHPQNAFWKIMTALFQAPVETYDQRVALIKQNGLALWDVLKFCERHGSLDTSIDDATIEVNDFTGFFKKYPDVRRVFFNGAKSEAEFLKRVLPSLPEKITQRLELHRLPSTSPAHAGMNMAAKLKAWRAIC
jgi:double-stranded uracil-DNA glycosylase